MNADERRSVKSVAGRPYRVPPALVGEGQGEGSLGLAEIADRRQHSVEIGPDLVVWNTPHAKASRSKPRIASAVVRPVQIMRLAVDLDDQMGFEADEVRDEGADRILAAKLVSARAPVAELSPQQSFSRSRLCSKFTRAFGRVHDTTIARNLHTIDNLKESPLPLWERARVRGLAPAGAEESAYQYAHSCGADGSRFVRAAARVPSPCPSPTRGEGTLQECLPSISSQESLP